MCRSQATPGLCRHYSLLPPQHTLRGAAPLTIPYRTTPHRPLEKNWAPRKPRTIYNYNCIKNQEMSCPSSPYRWFYPHANERSYFTLFHYKHSIVLNCCALLGNKTRPRELFVNITIKGSKYIC